MTERPMLALMAGALMGTLLLASTAAAQTATPAVMQTPTTARPNERVTGTGPGGATMRCRDGSYVTTAADDSCATKGGILVRFPLSRVPEAPAPRPRIAAPAIQATPAEAPPTDAAQASRANVVVPATRPPANATFMCVDGSFVVADTSRARCASRGGVRLTFPAKPRG